MKPSYPKPTEDRRCLESVEIYALSNSRGRIIDSEAEDHVERFDQSSGIKATTDIHVSVFDPRLPHLTESRHAVPMLPEHVVADQV